MKRGDYIYIMTNKNKTTLYIGVTSDLDNRVLEHREHMDSRSFTSRYKLEYCVYFEYFNDISQAIDRETQLKKWSRKKKEALINEMNPDWNTLV